MEVFTRRKVTVKAFTSERGAFQNLQQNLTGEVICIFRVIGVFKRYIADRCYKLTQRSVDSVMATVCFHIDILSLKTPIAELGSVTLRVIF